ncbi:lysylphosphatidylglycerol synthase domain-containing protein [Portibacter marinus]|uniref:lysylphosphatidylglycerol synthase domain-containing protein n=1 Tax=Portibacter marinus TaxID=2898660 RepID=UPI001F165EB0|nr:lysylphosphatidylglycerol synthase domain-containing protein [Portibacter marinus]
MANNSNKTVFWWNIILKLIFAFVLLFFLYRHLFQNNDLTQSWNHFILNFQEGTHGLLWFCILLMPINWAIESKKWHLLVWPFEKIHFLTAFKAILGGISVALLTPNRIGEYGGRMVVVEARNNWKAVISTLVSSFAQNIWNIGLGLIAAIMFLNISSAMESYLFLSGVSVSLIFFTLIILLYFNIDLIHRVLKKFDRFTLVAKSLVHLQLLKQYRSSTLAQVLLLAFIRYVVYLIQYFLILKFFGLDVDVVNGIIGIATIFLVQTSLPLPPIIGFLARGEIALLVWSTYELNEISVLAASYFLWFLNLILPALVGAVVILSSNLSRTFGLNRNYFK